MYGSDVKGPMNNQLNKSYPIAFQNDHIKMYSYIEYMKPSVSDIFSFLIFNNPVEINLNLT